MAVTLATPADFPYILSLSKRHAEEVGFLTAMAMQSYIDRRRVTLARENGDPAGYLLTGAQNGHVRIFQTCVQTDARNLRHGLDLISDLINTTGPQGTHTITLHCRDGLESNGFWAACGFSLEGLQLGGSARRKIVNVWRLSLRDALTNPALPYASRFFASLRTRPQTHSRSA